jgi:hypothetical protein
LRFAVPVEKSDGVLMDFKVFLQALLVLERNLYEEKSLVFKSV